MGGIRIVFRRLMQLTENQCVGAGLPAWASSRLRLPLRGECPAQDVLVVDSSEFGGDRAERFQCKTCPGLCRGVSNGSAFLLPRLAALLHQFGHHAGPSGLMAGADASARVSVEIFMKQNQIAPVRVGLELFLSSEDWPPARVVTQEYVGHAA